MCMKDMWVVQWCCVFEGLVKMCEVVGMGLYWKLIVKMMGVVCVVVAGFLNLKQIKLYFSSQNWVVI